jgi:hypothetical protein
MVFTTESPPRVPKEERDALHALYGLPRPRPNSSLWKYHEVFRTGYVLHKGIEQTWIQCIQMQVSRRTTMLQSTPTTLLTDMTHAGRCSRSRADRKSSRAVGERRGPTTRPTPPTGRQRYGRRERRPTSHTIFYSTGFSQSHHKTKDAPG